MGRINFEVGFQIDSLTVMMMLVVTFVSLMVHIYTIGYMSQDPGYQRFFSLHLAVHLLHADAGDVEQLRCSCSSAGKRWVWCPTC